MISIFHGADKATHEQFQEWRRRHPAAFNMTESAAGLFTIHWAQDRREHGSGRGCSHQGTSIIEYLQDKDSCYTTARKVCADDFFELLQWADAHGFRTKSCKHCDTKLFPFPAASPRA